MRTVRARIVNGGTLLACRDKGWLTTTVFPMSSPWQQTQYVNVYTFTNKATVLYNSINSGIQTNT